MPTHTEKAGKENWLYKDRGIGREQVDSDYVWYEVSEDIQMKKVQ